MVFFNSWKHPVDDQIELLVRLLDRIIVYFYLTFWIDNKDLALRQLQFRIRDCVGISVAESGVKWVFHVRKQLLNSFKTKYFEKVRLLNNHFPVHAFDHSIWT